MILIRKFAKNKQEKGYKIKIIQDTISVTTQYFYELEILREIESMNLLNKIILRRINPICQTIHSVRAKASNSVDVPPG